MREVFDWPDPNSTNRTDAAFFTGETYYAVTNGPYAITALTAATETGTTNTANATATLQLPEGQSCAVGVFMGTAEDVGSRKFHDGVTVNTLRKYTDEEKADDVHYTLQLKARKYEKE